MNPATSLRAFSRLTSLAAVAGASLLAATALASGERSTLPVGVPQIPSQGVPSLPGARLRPLYVFRSSVAYVGSGVWQAWTGEAGSYSSSVRVENLDDSSALVRMRYRVIGGSSEAALRWTFTSPTTFVVSLLSDETGLETNVGLGACRFNACTMDLNVWGTPVRETWTFSGNALVREGARAYAGGSLVWRETLATEPSMPRFPQ